MIYEYTTKHYHNENTPMVYEVHAWCRYKSHTYYRTSANEATELAEELEQEYGTVEINEYTRDEWKEVNL